MNMLRTVLDGYEEIRPYHNAFIEAVARSARSPDLRQQLAAHYHRQRDRVATWIVASLADTIEADDARHLASVMIATVDGLLIQTSSTQTTRRRAAIWKPSPPRPTPSFAGNRGPSTRR
jgi:BetI-type transcriptional repressor, C-terminal